MYNFLFLPPHLQQQSPHIAYDDFLPSAAELDLPAAAAVDIYYIHRAFLNFLVPVISSGLVDAVHSAACSAACRPSAKM